jgi:hypothetical protein
MSSRISGALFALPVLLAALVLGGCGSTAATIDPVAEAAVTTSHAGGAQLALHIGIELEGLASPLTLTGSGNFNFAAGEGELVSNLTGLPAAATGALHGSSIELTELYAKGLLYMHSPLLDGKLPNGARWIKLDLSELAAEEGLDVQSLSSGESNPAQILQYLRASGGSVTKLGTAEIRGTPTTHYRARIGLSELAAKAPGSDRGQLKAELEKLGSETGLRSLPVEVWIDAHDLVRRMSLTLSEAAAGAHVKVSLELELFNFGATPSVNAPAPGEVFDATHGSLGALSGAGL